MSQRFRCAPASYFGFDLGCVSIYLFRVEHGITTSELVRVPCRALDIGNLDQEEWGQSNGFMETLAMFRFRASGIMLSIADRVELRRLNRVGLIVVRQTASIAFLLSLVYSGWMSPPLRAQQTTGSILGTVEDAQGAVVVGAKVTAQNSETGLSRSVQSSSGGEYRIDFLPPGSYELQVTNTGFQSF